MNWSHKLIRKYFLGGDIECWNGECISLISLKLSFLPTYSSEMVSKWSKPLAVLSNFQSLWWNPRTAFQKFRNQMKPAWYWLHAALFVQRYYEDTRICCQHPATAFFGIPLPCCVFRWDWRWMHTYPIFLLPGAKVPSCDPVVFDGSQWLLAARPFLQYNSERTCELWTIHHPKMALE